MENSPMSSLALNLGNASIGLTARRKLALSDSPCDSTMAVPSKTAPASDRLLKNSLRFNTPVDSVTPVHKAGVVRLHPGVENLNPMISSPVKPLVSPSKFQAAVWQLSNSGGRTRYPLEDHDPNSQDSGYGQSEDSKSADFHFAQPNGLAPRRNTYDSRASISSTESVDDGFLDMLQDEEAQLPPGLGGLFTDPIINHGLSTESASALSFQHIVTHMSPVVEETPVAASKKRPSTAMDITPVSKRHKPLSDSNTPKQSTLFQFGFKRISEPRPILGHSLSLEEPLTSPHRPKFRHCLSESEAVIKKALTRSSEEDLIGDFSCKFILPIVTGSHQDLKSILPSTLARLIKGEFSNQISSYQIIDCRYPYEYEGGHIRGARNIFTKDQLMKDFLDDKTPLTSSTDSANTGRHIIVFHCEFSSERGPGLSRFLRSKDRESNAYPALHHPELYLLEGGYKAFFHYHKELCEPCAYRKMVDVDKDELQHFRAKSKTWSGDKTHRTFKRSASFKRLGL